MPGCPPGASRHLHGKLARGGDAASEDARQGGAALLARKEGLNGRCQAVGVAAQGVGTPRDDDQDHRPAGVKQRLDQLALDARQSEVLGVAALA